MLRIAAVIAAGGSGKRLGASLPKQFLLLAGKPVIVRTVEGILGLPDVEHVVVALPADHLEQAKQIFASGRWRAPLDCVAGGATRQDSVRRGVARVRKNADLILVHDAARPLCNLGTMQRVVEAAWEQGGAVPGIPATDTIQRVSKRNRILRTPPREELQYIQTPQGFRASILREALERAAREGFAGTDESSVVRWAGMPVAVVPGDPENIKITRPIDLEIAEMMMSKKEARSGRDPSMRVGQGLDYHRLVTGRELILGGVIVPFEMGLEGHSDADAVCHAMSDALLGAAALGDLGLHFPDNDPANRGRSSLEFLKHIRELLQAGGWSIVNLDTTIVAQRPKLAPHVPEMRRRIAEALGLDTGRISIKATTTEGMNAEGREEGISAHAIALLSRTETGG